MPVVVASGADGQTAHYCVVSTGAVLGHGRSNFLSWCRGRFLWSSVQKTINIHLLLLNTVIDVPVAQVVQFPLYLAVSCLVFGVRLWRTRLWIFLGFRKYFRIQHSLVRQWIHVRRQSTRSYGRISHVFDVPVVVQRQVHGQTVQIAVLVPLLRGRWHPCRGAVADSLGPHHCDSPVAAH